jgi:hypothetical protein
MLQCSVREKIQDIPSGAGFGAIQFGIPAIRTRYRNEPFVLYVKNLGKITAGGLKLVAFIRSITAFWAFIRLLFHNSFLVLSK